MHGFTNIKWICSNTKYSSRFPNFPCNFSCSYFCCWRGYVFFILKKFRNYVSKCNISVSSSKNRLEWSNEECGVDLLSNSLITIPLGTKSAWQLKRLNNSLERNYSVPQVVLIKLEVNWSKLQKDGCALSNWLQADENIILQETVFYNCVNEVAANGVDTSVVDTSVADPATCGPHVEKMPHKCTEF
jgi:hypothetical protein